MKSELKGIFSSKDLAPFTVHKNGINILSLLILYTLSFTIIGFYPHFTSPLYIIVGFLIMGAVQHTFATFVHEAAHFNLFTNRKVNDILGHVLCAAPLVSYMKDYRYFHFEHHRHTGKIDKDPELKFFQAMGVKPSYSSKAEVAKVFLNDLSGISYMRGLLYVLKFFGEKRKTGEIEKPTALENLAVLVWLTIVPIIMYKLGLIIPYLIFWVAPIFTLTPMLLRWHSFGEHIREKQTCASENTFTHRFSLIPTLFLYPINSSFHLEHHLYPQIPWYSLKKFYRWANENDVYARNSKKLTVDGYFIGKETIVSKAFPIEN